MTYNKIIVIGGPTASGKSQIALSLAEHYPVNIINADSCQVYGDIPILSAQPSEADKLKANHEIYGILAASEQFSVGKWLDLASKNIAVSWKQNKIPVIVGGTGMYLTSLINGLAYIPEVSAEVRAEVKDLYVKIGAGEFHKLLQITDPNLAAKIHYSDSQRMLRAMEVFLQTKTTLSEWQTRPHQSPFNQNAILSFVLNPERGNLYNHCNLRLDEMIKNGVLDEIKLLKNKTAGLPIMKALGARELLAYMSGETDLTSALSLAKMKTRNYAKRQITWFKHQMPKAKRIDYTEFEQLPNLVLEPLSEFLTK